MTVFRYTDATDCHPSSNLDYIYYNENNSTLCVEFLSGSRVGYRNVPKHVWEDFKRASSYGVFYNRFIKGTYHGLGVDFDDTAEIESPRPDELAAISQEQTFVVTGYVKKIENIRATSLENAVKHFNERYTDATVTEVTVKFT